MGQQQLLLLVLGTIIVGVAIVVGMNVFTSGAVQANKDAVVQDNMVIAARVLNYAKTPTEMGGGLTTTTGVRSAAGITLEQISWPVTNANATWIELAEAASVVTIVGTGHEGVEVTTTVNVTSEVITTTIVYPT